jgi:hypothetical protein
MAIGKCTMKEAFVAAFKTKEYQDGYTLESIRTFLRKCIGYDDESALSAADGREIDKLSKTIQKIVNSTGGGRKTWARNMLNVDIQLESLKKYTHRHARGIWRDEINQVISEVAWNSFEPPTFTVSKDSMTHGYYDKDNHNIVIPINLALYSCLLDAQYKLLPRNLLEDDLYERRSLFALSFPDTRNYQNDAAYKIRVLNGDFTESDAYYLPAHICRQFNHSRICRNFGDIGNFLRDRVSVGQLQIIDV